MSTNLFPTLVGQGFSIKRTPQWKTRKPMSISGKETAVADWSTERYQWDLVFNVLRVGTMQGQTFSEMQTLMGFYNARQGGFDTFQYQDQDDNAVTNQAIANTVTGGKTGDGSTVTFQLLRGLGGGVIPVLAPNVVSHVYVNGVDPGGWSVSLWGSTTPGIVTFGSAPGSGQAVTATFSYYWPCRFVEDKCEFEKFDNFRYTVKKMSFMSVK